MALFLIQEMRDAKLEISLVHYRSAVLACSRTRQLAGVIPLLEEMRKRGVVADVETYNAAISSCTVDQVRLSLDPSLVREVFFARRRTRASPVSRFVPPGNEVILPVAGCFLVGVQ